MDEPVDDLLWSGRGGDAGGKPPLADEDVSDADGEVEAVDVEPRCLDARPARRPEQRWYGWQFFFGDAAALTTMLAAQLRSWNGRDDDFEKRALDGPFLFGAGAFVLGAPIVHLGHGRVKAAALSLFLRAVAPVSTGAVVMSIPSAPSLLGILNWQKGSMGPSAAAECVTPTF